MGKIIKLDSKNHKQEKQYAPPNGRYKLSEGSKIIYTQNYDACINLFLIKPREYPSLAELESMPVYQARKIMKKLDTLYDEKANERSIKLTGKSLQQHAADKIDKLMKDITKK